MSGVTTKSRLSLSAIATVGAAVWLLTAALIAGGYYLADVKPAVRFWTGIDRATGEKTGGKEFDGWHVFQFIVPHQVAIVTAVTIVVGMVVFLLLVVALFCVSPTKGEAKT